MNGEFRVWNNKPGGWLNHQEELYLSTEGDVMRVDGTKHVDILRFCNAEPEFFIGMEDKNGIKIFQGDLVKVDDNSIFEIIWLGAGFWFYDIEEDMNLIFDPKVYKLEIVGNIHEPLDVIGTKC